MNGERKTEIERENVTFLTVAKNSFSFQKRRRILFLCFNCRTSERVYEEHKRTLAIGGVNIYNSKVIMKVVSRLVSNLL